jgi:hypothetical protein
MRIERQWNFKSAQDVEFVMQDTLKIIVHFPGKIPDDRLIGYTRFRIVIADSNAGGSISGASFLYRILFDAGFLHFDHVLTFEMNYASKLFAGRTAKPQKYQLYLDPFPVSRMHQWFAAPTFGCDTVKGVFRFTYVHHGDTTFQEALKMYRPSAGLKSCPASSGYPYEYGLFYADSGSSVRFDRRHLRMGEQTWWDGQQSGQVQMFSLNGRCVVRQSTGYGSKDRYPSACYIAREGTGKHSMPSRALIFTDR